VPTQPTLLWSIWFLYVTFGMLRGRVNKMLPIYALLIGFTYHIHIALLPVIILPPISYLLSGGKLRNKFKKIDIKKVILSVVIFLLVSSPFWIFEIKYGFSQTQSVLAVGKIETGEPEGWLKLRKVIDASGKEFQERLLNGLGRLDGQFMWLFFLSSALILVKIKKITGKQLLIMLGWVLLILLMQYISKRKVSEYYFTNLVPIFMIFITLLLKVIYEKYGKTLLLCLLFFWLLLNVKWVVSNSLVSDSYLYKKQLVEFIENDATAHNYPCVPKSTI
jgi:hypothetical protein